MCYVCWEPYPVQIRKWKTVWKIGIWVWETGRDCSGLTWNPCLAVEVPDGFAGFASTAAQSQKTVAACFTSKQLLPFGFAGWVGLFDGQTDQSHRTVMTGSCKGYATSFITLTTLEYFCINHGDRRVFSISNVTNAGTALNQHCVTNWCFFVWFIYIFKL